MNKISRRKFLGWIGAAGTAAFVPRNVLASKAESIKISIIHTTDLHGHILPTSSYEGENSLGGFARCASQIRAWKKANPASLLLDAGDVFQGTDIGWRTRGEIMTRCFNAMDYDGWTVGNHEFDWGMEALSDCLRSSKMPALSANVLLEGQLPGKLDAKKSPLGHIKPSLLKDVGGFKIGVIGLTTPGLPYWFQPSFFEGFDVQDPAEAAAREAAELKSLGADAIVLLSHMGKASADNFSNRLESVATAVPDAALIIAGHTHRDNPADKVRGIPYTQAAYHGLNLGLAHLFFDPVSRKLTTVETSTHRMTDAVPLDPVILSLAAADLEASSAELASPVGKIAEALSSNSQFGKPSDVEGLIAASIFEALGEREVALDGVWHGSFSQEDLAAGNKTVDDMWALMPYENFVVTGELTAEEMIAAFRDAYGESRQPSRSLMGLRLIFSDSGNARSLVGVEDKNGNPLPRGQRYRVAMNTYDASSGGGRMLKLREIMRSPAVNATIHPVQTREALIAFVSKRGENGVRKDEIRRYI